MPSLSRAWMFGLLWLGVSASGCLFPVIDFDDHSAPHELALRTRPKGYAHANPNLGERARATSTGLTTVPPRQHPRTAGARSSSAATRPSVIAPDVPAPELPTPTDAADCHRMLRGEGVRFRVVDSKLTPGV